MAHPVVADIERVATFTVVSSQTDFPVAWPVFQKDGITADASLDVYHDGALIDPADWAFTGTFADGVAGGGTVVLDTAVTSGTVRIVGHMPGERSSDYQAGGLSAAAVNTDLDRIWAAIREMQLVQQRSIKIPAYEDDADETPVDQVAPALATRASQGMAWDVNGRPTVGTATALNEILTALNDLVSGAADRGVYWTAANAAALFTLTSAARTLLAQTTQALMRTTGLGLSADGSSLVTAANFAAMKALLDLEIGTDVQAFNVDTLFADVAATLTVGFDTTPFSAGTKSSGTFTPDPDNGNIQYAVNGGAHTLAPPASACSMAVEYLNNASAGAITTSGFTKVDGAFTTTNGHKFIAQIIVTQNYSYLNIVALQ